MVSQVSKAALEQGRSAFERAAWAEAFASLSAAGGALDPEDLERLAMASQLVGRDDVSSDALARAHTEFLRAGAATSAARCAFWLTMSLLLRGEVARANGWLARGQRVLDEAGLDCAERGYLAIPIGVQALFAGDPATAQATFAEVAALGARFADRDLTAFGRLGLGQSLLVLGSTAAGLALFDELMVAVTADELSPLTAGIVYCAVISACRDSFDLRRAREWTAALQEWCDARPDIVTFRGVCRVHRAEILNLRGAWAEAMDESRRACETLSARAFHPAIADAYYQQGELHRLRGEFAEAEGAYREASRWGRDPEPGLAQLRLVQGRLDVAAAAIRRVVDETTDRAGRSRLLAAHVEIVLNADDVPSARAAADELAALAAHVDMPLLGALAAHADGAVRLRDGDARGAIAALRRALATWHELEVPYEAARTRVLIGLACRALGDQETAELEFDAARVAFEALGAAPDLARLDRLVPSPASDPAGLSTREREVLTYLASGKTNREIAEALFIAERTVARHVANIFTKLGVSSRSAATAWAYEHRLAGGTTQN
jgi:DNA-binding CsgD family transcriptional regulator